ERTPQQQGDTHADRHLEQECTTGEVDGAPHRRPEPAGVGQYGQVVLEADEVVVGANGARSIRHAQVQGPPEGEGDQQCYEDHRRRGQDPFSVLVRPAGERLHAVPLGARRYAHRSPLVHGSREGDTAVGKIVKRSAQWWRVASRWPATRQRALLAVLVVEELLEGLVRLGDRRVNVATGDCYHDRPSDDLASLAHREHQRALVTDAGRT